MRAVGIKYMYLFRYGQHATLFKLIHAVGGGKTGVSGTKRKVFAKCRNTGNQLVESSISQHDFLFFFWWGRGICITF